MFTYPSAHKGQYPRYRRRQPRSRSSNPGFRTPIDRPEITLGSVVQGDGQAVEFAPLDLEARQQK